MRVELALFASFGTFYPEGSGAGRGSRMIEVPDGLAVGDLIARLRLPENVPKVVFVNNRHADESAVLSEGDRVGIFPPVAGG